MFSTREAARSSGACYHVLASVYFFLFFNWSVPWRSELFSREADFISTCKCPGMQAGEAEMMGRERILGESQTQILGVILQKCSLLFPDKSCFIYLFCLCSNTANQRHIDSVLL